MIGKLTRTILRTFAFALALCATTSAWAASPTPVVVWDGASSDYDFNELTRSGYTINTNVSSITASTIGGDGAYIQIGDGDGIAGVSITNPTVGTFGSGGTTVIIRYSDLIKLSSNRALIALMDDNEFSDDSYDTSKKNHAKVGLGQSNGTYGEAVFIGGGRLVDTYLKGSFAEGMQTLAFVCNSSQMAFYVNGNYRTNRTHSYGSITPTGIMLGGLDVDNSGRFYALKNLKIYAVAIFDRELTAEEIAAYKFPASDSGTPAKWQYANYMLTWQTPDTASTGNMSVNTSIFQYYDNYLNQEKTTTVPGGTAWYWFCYGQHLRNPGVVLRLKNGSYNKTLGGNFDNCTFAGLKVESDASGYKIEQNDASKRGTILGDVSGNAETWFEIGSSFSIKRTGSFYLSGIVNIDIADDAVLSLNDEIASVSNGSASHYPAICASVDSGVVPGGALKMHGEGRLETTKLTATGACLDYSDLSASRTVPYIDAELVVNSSTSYKFPALSGAATYQLSNSLSDTSGITGDQTFSIGGHEYQAPLTFNDSDGTVNFPAVATLVGSETPIAWSAIAWDAKPATIDNTTVATLNIAGNTTLDIDSAIAVEKLVLNIADGVTFTLINDDNLTTVEGIVIRGTGTLKIDGAVTCAALVVEDNVTLAYNSPATSLVVSGAITVSAGKTLTLAPSAISTASSTIISAASISGTVSVTLPSESGVDYSTIATETSYKIVRTPNVAFSYDGTIGAAPTGWFTAWGGEGFGARLRVGPNSGRSIVYEVYHDSNEVKAHPYYELSARSAFSFALYADVSQVGSDGRKVLASFGKSSAGLVLYRQGDCVRVARVTSAGFTGDWTAAVAIPPSGYHLYTVTYDPNGTIALYLDDGASSSSSSTLGAMSLDAGMQIGGMYQGVPTADVFNDAVFAQGVGMAFAAIRCYDSVLAADNVKALAQQFPATDNSYTHTVDLNATGKTLTVYDATFTGECYLGVSNGALVIPENNTVSVPHVRLQESAGTVTADIYGRLEVTSVSTGPNVHWDGDANKYKGILFGKVSGAGTGSVTIHSTGALVAPNAWLQTVFRAGNQIITIDGGLMQVKGLFSDLADKSSLVLQNGGTLEVDAVTDKGQSIAANFRYGTFRIASDVTLPNKLSTAFIGTLAQPTTLDPHGNTLTLESAALTGSGYITVASSAEGETKGSVVFGANASFGGKVILTDANRDLMNISAYKGGILYSGTEAGTLAKLDGFGGTVYFTSNIDTSAVDLSGATVNVAENCTLTTDAGKEGKLVLGSGAVVTLKVTTEIVNYEGHVPVVSGSGTVGYYNTGTSEAVSGADHVNGNNLLPYYNVWSASATASENTLSDNAAARWKSDDGVSGVLPADNKNVAFYITNDTTLLVDATTSWGDVQVYGSGTLTFQSKNGGAISVSGTLQTTASTSITIESGITFTSGSELEIVSPTTPTLMSRINCGTELSPFSVPSVIGGGTLYLTDSAVVAIGSADLGTIYVAGSISVSGAASFGTLTVVDAGDMDIATGASVVATTAAIQGAINVASSGSFIPESASGHGFVTFDGRLPTGTAWTTGSATTGWRGTVWIKNKSGLENFTPQSYGNAYSVVRLTNIVGHLAKNNNCTVPVELYDDPDNSSNKALTISNGWSGSESKFSVIKGSGTLKSTIVATMNIRISDWSDFTGSIEVRGSRIIFGSGNPGYADNGTHLWQSIFISSGADVSIPSGKTWTTNNGIEVEGTLRMNGTTALSGTWLKFASGAELVLDDVGVTASNATLTLPSEGTVTLDVGGIELSADSPTTLMTVKSGLSDETKFVLDNAGALYTLVANGTTLTAQLKGCTWDTSSDGTGTWSSESFNGAEMETDGCVVKFVPDAGSASAVSVTLDGTRTPADVVFNGGDTTYTLTGGAFEPTGTVTVESGAVVIESAATGTYVVEAGAKLTLANATVTSVSGEGELYIPAGATVKVSAEDAISVGRLTGSGTLQIIGTMPESTVFRPLLQNSTDWAGTLWISNATDVVGFNFDTCGNVNSKIKLTEVNGSFVDNEVVTYPLELVDGIGASKYAFQVKGATANTTVTIAEIKGDGWFLVQSTGNKGANFLIQKWNDFDGTAWATSERIIFGSSVPDAIASTWASLGQIYICNGAEVTVPVGKTWTGAYAGFVVEGTLNVNGSLNVSAASLDAVKGHGTVRYNGKLPEKTSGSRVYWTNSGWRGTVAISGYSSPFSGEVGLEYYGNENSFVELSNTSIYWFHGYTTAVGPTLVLKDDGEHVAFTVADGSSDAETKFAALKGDGAFETKKDAVYQLYRFSTAADFTGSITNLGRRIVFGTNTTPAKTTQNNSITLEANVTAGLGDGATWKSSNIYLSGILDVKGSGKLDGAVTLNDGAKIKVNDGAKNLTATSTVTWPVSGNVTFDLSAVSASAYKIPVITASAGAISGFDPSSVIITPPAGSTWASSDRWTTYVEDGDSTTKIYGVVVKPGAMFLVY